MVTNREVQEIKSIQLEDDLKIINAAISAYKVAVLSHRDDQNQIKLQELIDLVKTNCKSLEQSK